LSVVNGVDYRGCQTTTRSGKKCQKWSDQTPHNHDKNDVNYPGTGLGNHNYCRNPTGEDTIWCYTTNNITKWEYCNPIEEDTSVGNIHSSSDLYRNIFKLFFKGFSPENFELFFKRFTPGNVEIFS